jgi:hypothetical protein
MKPACWITNTILSALSLGGSQTYGAYSQSVNIELGRAANAAEPMNDPVIRTFAGKGAGAISFYDFYGKGSRPVGSAKFTKIGVTNYTVPNSIWGNNIRYSIVAVGGGAKGTEAFNGVWYGSGGFGLIGPQMYAAGSGGSGGALLYYNGPGNNSSTVRCIQVIVGGVPGRMADFAYFTQFAYGQSGVLYKAVTSGSCIGPGLPNGTWWTYYTLANNATQAPVHRTCTWTGMTYSSMTYSCFGKAWGTVSPGTISAKNGCTNYTFKVYCWTQNKDIYPTGAGVRVLAHGGTDGGRGGSPIYMTPGGWVAGGGGGAGGYVGRLKTCNVSGPCIVNDRACMIRLDCRRTCWGYGGNSGGWGGGDCSYYDSVCVRHSYKMFAGSGAYYCYYGYHGGGGGGGAVGSTAYRPGAGGGGVGVIQGQGWSGYGGQWRANDKTCGGLAGSSGTNGGTQASTSVGGGGGLYGGGGGGAALGVGNDLGYGNGAQGVVRIVWPGCLRKFPSTYVCTVPASSGGNNGTGETLYP